MVKKSYGSNLCHNDRVGGVDRLIDGELSMRFCMSCVPAANLPKDFPNWSTVYGVFWKWRNEDIWQRIHDKHTRESEKSSW